MNSIDQTLDHLADLFLTGPVDEDRLGSRFVVSHDASGQRISPTRIAPKRSTSGQHRSPSHVGLTLIRPESEKLLDPLEQMIASSLDRPVVLAVQYPRDRQIRLMVDRDGRVHLWRSQVDANIHAGLVSLITARFWVREHIELIALTEPTCKFDMEAEPMLHVLTGDATKAEALDSVFGPFMKVHVQDGW